MLDFNLYYAQTAAETQRRQLHRDTRGVHPGRRVLHLSPRREGRDGSGR
jgi:hypothetical protein